jgi:hypothetical protein
MLESSVQVLDGLQRHDIYISFHEDWRTVQKLLTSVCFTVNSLVRQSVGLFARFEVLPALVMKSSGI